MTAPDSLAYSDNVLVEEARSHYLAAKGLSVRDYDDSTFTIGIAGLSFRFPNTRGPKRAIRHHDLHHILTGFGTDWIGEAEIGAWELRAGCNSFITYYLNGWAVTIGLFISPRRVWQAFRSARRQRTLYGDPLPYDRLLQMNVGELRKRLGISFQKQRKRALEVDATRLCRGWRKILQDGSKASDHDGVPGSEWPMAQKRFQTGKRAQSWQFTWLREVFFGDQQPPYCRAGCDEEVKVLQGNVVSIYIASSAGMPMESRQQVQAIRGRGLEGDRYFDGKGHWSNNPGVSRQVTLIEIEAMEALARDNNIELAPAAARRNLVTRGVPLNHLVGREFQIGSVRLRGTKLCEPCKYLEELTVPGLIAGLTHRGGLRADIVSGGTIRAGEPITDEDTKMSHRGRPGMIAFEPETFSRDWVAAWNRLDVEAILAHYVDDAVFVSPLAATVTGDAEVHGKDKLRTYWTTAIRRRASPLRFALESVVWNDENRVLLIIFVSTEANGNLRKCELMHFGLNGLIYRGEAFVGATTP